MMRQRAKRREDDSRWREPASLFVSAIFVFVDVDEQEEN